MGFVLFLVFAGCGSQKDEGGPTITAFQFDRQFPGDPYTAVLSFAFQAGDKGVGLGYAEFYTGGDAPVAKLKLGDLLAASGLARTAKAGEIGAALRFTASDIKDGSQVELSLVLVDDNNKRSNRAHVRLEFDLP